MVREEDLIGKVIFKHLKEGIEPCGCLGENIPGKGSSMCKGPVIGVCLVCLKNGKDMRSGIKIHGKC